MPGVVVPDVRNMPSNWGFGAKAPYARVVPTARLTPAKRRSPAEKNERSVTLLNNYVPSGKSGLPRLTFAPRPREGAGLA